MAFVLFGAGAALTVVVADFARVALVTGVFSGTESAAAFVRADALVAVLVVRSAMDGGSGERADVRTCQSMARERESWSRC